MTETVGDDRPPAIQELDSLTVGPAPIRAVLDAGHTAKRRRRTVLASVTAVAVLLVGGGFVTTQVLGNARSTDPEPAAEAAERDLVVDVSPHVMPSRNVGVFQGLATWDASNATLTYVSRDTYSGGACLPIGIVEDDGSSLALTLTANESQPCLGVAYIVDTTISGLTKAPTELTVTEDDGQTRTIPVIENPNGQSQDLSVTVDFLAPDGDEAVPPGTAQWDPERMTLAYVPETNYDACLTNGSATASNGSVNLELTPPTGDIACADVASTALVTISGLTEAPAELTITEDGETRTIPVANAEPAGDGLEDEQDTFTVADLIGLNERQAVDQLRASGHEGSVEVVRVADNTAPDGTVTAQEPAPGDEMSLRGDVVLTVAALLEPGEARTLLIRNETSGPIFLTFEGGFDTRAKVGSGKTVTLASPAACEFSLIRASNSNGEVIDTYARPCKNQTWVIQPR